MAIIFISGFDLDANRLEPPLTTTDTTFISEPGRRPESKCLTRTNSSTGNSNVSYPLPAYNDPANNFLDLTIGMAVKFDIPISFLNDAPVVLTTKWGGTGSSESNAYLSVNNTGTISFGSAVSAPGVFSTGTWHYVEVSWKVTGSSSSANSSAGVQTIRLDGVEVASSAAEGRGKFSSLAFNVMRRTSPTGKSYIDDLYIADDDIFRGDVRVDTLVPNANSTPQDWSGSDPLKQNWELINSRDDLTSLTDNIYTFNDGDKSYFEMEDLSLSGYEVLGVQAQYIAQKTDAGLGQIHFAVKDSAGEQVTTDALAMSSNFFGTPVYETDSTNAPWNLTKVNDIELGFEADLP